MLTGFRAMIARSLRNRSAGAVAAACLAMTPLARAAGVPTTINKVVIVIEENKSYTDIHGNTVDAPYINNTLIAQGANFTQSFGSLTPASRTISISTPASIKASPATHCPPPFRSTP